MAAISFTLQSAISSHAVHFSVQNRYGSARAKTAGFGRGNGLDNAPIFLTTLTESYVDIPYLQFLASVRFAVLASRDKSAAILAAGMAGITVGIKSTGLLLAAMTYVLHLSLTFKANRKTWFKVNGQFTLWMIIMILVLGSVFYIRNWIIAGNPIFPVPLSLPFIGPLTSLEHYSYSLPHSTFMAQWDFLLYSGKWLNAILGESITLSGGWGLGPLDLWRCSSY